MKKENIFIFLFSATLASAHASLPSGLDAHVQKVEVMQDDKDLVAVSGMVYDEATRQPLAGVQIRTLQSNRYAAMTGTDGKFSIRVPRSSAVLYVSAPQYQPQQVAIGMCSEIYMLSDAFQPLYGEGTELASSRMASASYGMATTADDPICGMLGGDVRGIVRSGAPAAGANFFVRGLNTLNANAQPLIIVDGVELDMQHGRSSLHQGSVLNMLSSIMPSDIERITVLKNGTALYGARGANGVIVITTKRSHSMATRIDVDVATGLVFKPSLPTMMDASQYRIYTTQLVGTIEGVKQQTLNLPFLNDDPSNYYYHTYHNDTDWKKQVYRNALSQNYSVNVQGGDDVGMYNLSLGYTDAASTAKKNDFGRMNVRFNTDINIVKNLDALFNLSIAKTTQNLFDDGFGSNLASSAITSPTVLGLIKSPLLYPYQYNNYLGGFSNLLSPADDLFSGIAGNTSLANPVAILEQAEGTNKNYLENTFFQASLQPVVTLSGDWKLSELFSYSLNRNTQRYTRPSTGVPSFDVSELGKVYNKFATASSKENHIYSNTALSYSHLFGAHSLAGKVGFSYNVFNYDSDVLSSDFTSAQDDKNPHISASADNYNQQDGANEQWKQMQWYGNVDYSYRNTYYLSLALLGEANSRFGSHCDGLSLMGVKWALFPSVQLGWVMSAEPWFPKTPVVNYLKLTTGYDLSGNDDISNYAAMTVHTMVKFNHVANGLQMTNIGNEDIKWETTRKWNVGLQARMLHNRLALSLDYYVHKTDDLLTLSNFPTPVLGINKYWTNGGKLENKGFELSVSGIPVVTRDWRLEVGVSAGHYKNKLLSLVDGDYTTSIYGEDNILTRVGSPLGLFYGYKTEGIFTSDAEAKAANLYFADDTGAKHYFQGGDVHFADIHQDGVIDAKDKTVIGDPNPDIYGNIHLSLGWKNVSLSAAFNYSLGNDIYNYQRSILNSGATFYNQQVAVTNAWQVDGQTTSMPRIAYGDPMGNNRFSDRWIEDGSYLRLKTLRLSYRIPVNTSWLQGLTVWAEAANLFTVTKYTGADPEVSCTSAVLGQGIDVGNIAQGKAVNFGLRINL